MSIKMPKVIQGLCQPAYVYFVLSTLSSLFYVYAIIDKSRFVDMPDLNINNYTICGLILHVIIAIIWIYILNLMCRTPIGKKFAWFFVLLPFLLIALIIIGISGALSYMLVNQNKVKEIDDKVEKQRIIIESLQNN